jgi:cytochrome P450
MPRYAYLPFDAGPHVCIGNHFAMMEAQLVLATLVQRVTFELLPGQTIELEPLITLRPKGEIRVVVRRR